MGLDPQGDVLITSCTYNTGDRKLATVVSHPDFSLLPTCGMCEAWGGGGVPFGAFYAFMRTSLKSSPRASVVGGQGVASLTHPVNRRFSGCGPWVSSCSSPRGTW